ncbi:PH domain-containing protein [Flavobacterium sp.]|uniref:PH domain-containing protein n=1 Tax=Flavobacterium sp. TaxID=239 RepID=UPI00286DC6EC|nr:PH domain-containing protein [Flavobacterium sp.]
MKEQFKKFLNEDQDPKAIEKITNKLQDLLMKNEEIGYIGVQKKPAINVFPDSIVLTNKRIIMCKPKNFGLSMDIVDYDWDDIAGTFVKENILGSEFSFSTKTELVINIDYIPKTQARKLHTYAKEQLDFIKNPVASNPAVESQILNQESVSFLASDPVENQVSEEVSEEEPISFLVPNPIENEIVEEVETEEVFSFSEIVPANPVHYEPIQEAVSPTQNGEKKLNEMSSDELFAKLQNYKRLLDNGLIMQGEYDSYKKEILAHM